MKVVITLLIMFLSITAYSATYKIVERDMLEELQEKISKADYKKYFESEKKRFLENKGVTLPKARDNVTRVVDTTYILERDIPKVNEKGEIIGMLYPKGYTFNPVDYSILLPPPMIIFNACDTQEREEVERLLKTKKFEYSILVSSGCSIQGIKSVADREVKLLPQKLVETFQLRYTISTVLVSKEKRGYEITEIALQEQ